MAPINTSNDHQSKMISPLELLLQNLKEVNKA